MHAMQDSFHTVNRIEKEGRDFYRGEEEAEEGDVVGQTRREVNEETIKAMQLVFWENLIFFLGA